MNIKEFWVEPLDDEFNDLVKFIETSDSFIKKGRSCFMFGHGKQTTENYSQVSSMGGVELVCKEFFGPKWLKPLSFLVASQAGLFKFYSKESIGDAIEILSNLAMVSIFSVDSKFESDIVDYVKKSDYKNLDIKEFIKKDSSFFSLIIDGDNSETESGMLAIITCGPDCPKKLRSIFNNLGEYGYFGKRILRIN